MAALATTATARPAPTGGPPSRRCWRGGARARRRHPGRAAPGTPDPATLGRLTAAARRPGRPRRAHATARPTPRSTPPAPDDRLRAGRLARRPVRGCGGLDRRRDGRTPALSPDQVLDDVMLYWLPGTGTSSARLYWESIRLVSGWFTDTTTAPSTCRPAARSSPPRSTPVPIAGPNAGSPTSALARTRPRRPLPRPGATRPVRRRAPRASSSSADQGW